MRLIKRRSSRYAPAGPGYVPSSARDWPAVPYPGLTAGDAVELVGPPQLLAPGSRLRAEPCLMCGQAASGCQVRLVALTTCWPSRRSTGRLTGWVYMVHADHMPANFDELHRAARRVETLARRGQWPA